MEYSSPIQYLDENRANASTTPLVCYAPTMVSMNGIWHGERPFDYSLPLFMFQLLLIILANRLSFLVLSHLNQPRHIAQIVGGLIMSPSVLGRIPFFSMTIFPLRSVLVLEAVANLGLIFFIFAVGVELELTVLPSMSKKSIAFALSCIVTPVAVSILATMAITSAADPDSQHLAFIAFMGVVLTITAFSVLASMLTNLKLLGSELGRLTVSCALANDAVAWVLLSLAISLQQGGGNVLSALWTVVSGCVFTACCFTFVRPVILWVDRHTPEGEDVDELHACGILVGVIGASFLADMIGTHAIFGAFVYGLAVPNGMVGERIIENIEDFVNGIILPIFFALSGLRTDLRSITDKMASFRLACIMVAASASKVGGCALSALMFNMPVQDGIELGLLMNAKGIIQLIILNIGKDKRIINGQGFTVLLITSLVLTVITNPVVNMVAKSTRRFVAYKRRTIQWGNPDSELRILACVHHPRNVPSLITLLDITHPTKRSPIFVYALHLIELTGRAATLLVNSTASKDSGITAGTKKANTQSEQVVNAFETYEQHAGGVSVQMLTVFSPYHTMNEDICSVAEDKHVAFILMPFHKHQTVDGFMEETNPAIRILNQNTLSSTPCSIAILIDRGICSAVPRNTSHSAIHVAMIFFGAPDDREGLAFASRMLGHPSIVFTLLRFLPVMVTQSSGQIAIFDNERRLDEASLNDFRSRWEGIGGIEYIERTSTNAEETVEGIRDLVQEGFDLYIVGRGYGSENPLTAGLTDWSDCPELGAIGDLLSTSEFSSSVSILVIQQGKIAEGVEGIMPESPGKHVKVNVNSRTGW